MNLILASTSRFRRALLDRLGVPYEARAHSFDESSPPGGLTPGEVADRFALGKARSVEVPAGVWVLGSDQVLDLDGALPRKPETVEEAAEQLYGLGGRRHVLRTAVALVCGGREPLRARVDVGLTVRRLTLEQCRRYAELERPVGCVGGYMFEGRGIGLFERVENPEDDSAIVGLPLLTVGRLLREAGWEVLP